MPQQGAASRQEAMDVISVVLASSSLQDQLRACLKQVFIRFPILACLSKDDGLREVVESRIATHGDGLGSDSCCRMVFRPGRKPGRDHLGEVGSGAVPP